MSETPYDLPNLGGLKIDLPSQLLQKQYSPDLNAVWPFNGRIRRIPGKQQLSTFSMDGSGGVMGLNFFQKNDGSSYLVACSQDKAYNLNASSMNWTNIHSGSDFTGGDSDLFDYKAFFDSGGDEILVMTNGVDNIKKWTGTGTISDLGGSPDKARYLETYKNYLIKCGILTAPRTMQWSALGNGESHPVGNFLTLNQSPGWIIRPKALRDSLVLYKQDSISIVDFVAGDLIFRCRENYIGGHGLMASKSVLTYGFGSEVHFYIGSDFQIHQFDLVESPQISVSVSQVLQNLDPTTRPYIIGVRTNQYDKQIWAIPGRGQTGNRDLLVYDLKTNSFWVHNGEAYRVFSMCEAKVGTGGLAWDSIVADQWDTWDVPAGWDGLNTEGDTVTSFLAIGAPDGKVRKLISGADDDGTAMSSYYTYPFDNLDGDDQTEKMLTKIILELGNEGSGTVSLQVFTNSNDQTPVVQTDDLLTSTSLSLAAADSNARFINYEVDVCVVGYNFSIKILSTGATWGGRVLKLIWQPIGKKIV